MRKFWDLPPVWLAGCLVFAWLGRGGQAGGAVAVLGVVLVAGGLALMLAAVVEMSRARTTVWPHGQPRALVTGGVFRFSRNPIYLGDVMVLLGAVLWWQAFWALLLLPFLVIVLERRFILPEEARLRAAFGPEFAIWSAAVRRWL